MFTIAGILADEEPKTATSPSGLYNTSDMNGAIRELDTVLLGGRCEFTIMFWINRQENGAFTIYQESSPFSFPLQFSGSTVNISLANSNGGNTVISNYPLTTTFGQWYHWCITGSVSNGRLRLYRDGVLLTSSTMTYSNASSTKGRFNQCGVDMSQVNVYDRELTEVEVAEHYVYDEDTMQVGVLGWDAMTPAQRSGLIYSSSFTKDISISGNEFTDKSGNGITLSPQPSLTGEQIYIYTDANDLPSATTVYPLSSMNTTGTGSLYTNDSSFNMSALKASGMSISMFVDTTSAPNAYLANFSSDSSDGTPVELAMKIQGGSGNFTVEGYNGAPFKTISTNIQISSQGLTHIGLTLNAGASVAKLYIDGVEEATGNLSTLNVSSTGRLAIAEGQFGNIYFPTNGLKAMPRVTNREITASEMLYFAQNPSVCYADIDNTSGLKDATIYAPTLGEYNGSVAQALIDPASGIITNEAGTVTYDGTGVSVECT